MDLPPLRIPRAGLKQAVALVPNMIKMLGQAAPPLLADALNSVLTADSFKLILKGKTIGKVVVTGEIY